MKYNKIAGRNISLDQYFTNVTLAKWCLEKRVSIAGTMRTDRKGIPKDMKELGNCEEKPTELCYSEHKKMFSLHMLTKSLWKEKFYSTRNKMLEWLVI